MGDWCRSDKAGTDKREITGARGMENVDEAVMNQKSIQKNVAFV